MEAIAGLQQIPTDYLQVLLCRVFVSFHVVQTFLLGCKKRRSCSVRGNSLKSASGGAFLATSIYGWIGFIRADICYSTAVLKFWS